ncbi:MAG TPA: helix-turn-helix transcriptional regulator [Pseudonocardiaceae bacterium]|nr:helix-turn-helix transcriptional regulator [Pseudonocardiaceae bacterium]
MLDPALFVAPAMRAALRQRDISRVYCLLNDAGVPQRTIAELVGQSQSEVSEIINGRRVQSYDVLTRIYAGLGVPREAMELSFGAYPVDSSVSEPGEEDEADVLRRQFEHLLALAGVAVLGTAIPGLGKLSSSALPGQPLAVPARIGRADVETIHDLTRAVAVAARTVGGQAGPACSLADWADRCLTAEASDTTRQALLSALADLHVIAAWCCHDSDAPVPAHQHFARAVELATQAGDNYRASYALRHAAAMLIDRGEPNNALKLTQLAELHLTDAPRDDPRVTPLRCELVVVGALAQAQLADPGFAADAHRIRSELARSRDGWDPPSAHGRADMDLVTSVVHLHLGLLDIAESMAAVAVRTFAEGNYGREGVLARITVARLHLITGEPDAGRLAAQAIEAVSPLRSGVARTQLAPLAQDLETRRGPDFAELAHQARQTAMTRL